MKIRGKLNLAFIPFIAGFLVALGSLFYIQTYTGNLNSMYKQGVEFRKSFYTLNIATKDLLIREQPLDTILAKWEKALTDFETALTDLQKHPARNNLPSQIESKVASLQKIWNNYKQNIQAVSEKLDNIKKHKDIKDMNKKGILLMINTLPKYHTEIEDKMKLLKEAKQKLSFIDSSFRVSIISNINKTLQGITAHINNFTLQGYKISAIIAAAVTALSIFFLILFSRRLSGRIIDIKQMMEKISNQDLTVRIPEQAKDELTTLSRHLNKVLILFSSFIKDVDNAAIHAGELKDTVAAGTTESASSLNQITQSIESIRTQFGKLNDYVGNTANSVHSIVDIINRLSERIASQDTEVDNSSSSIEQMNAAIQNITELSNSRKNHADEISRIITEGGEKVNSTNEYMRTINSEISGIMEIIEIINGISEQTNILSMNAAIESAHAGEAGKGFSVVAEEIRTLAESTTENARKIEESLNAITTKIKQALTTSEESRSLFTDINNGINQLTEALAEISGSMTELSQGSNEILNVTNTISSNTKEIKESFSDITEKTKNIQKAMNETSVISNEVTTGMEEIEQGSKEVLYAVQNIQENSEESKIRMEKLHKTVRTFTIEKDTDR